MYVGENLPGISCIGSILKSSLFPFRRLLRRLKHQEPRKRSVFIRDANQKNLIVFIHGITGNVKDTWTNKTTGAYWPELIEKDLDLHDYDIYAVNYASPLFRGGANVNQIATRLLQSFTDEDLFNKYENLYFICHSMGGLIAKRILLQLNAGLKLNELRRVKAVMFLSTPTAGSRLATIAAWFTSNPQWKDLRTLVDNSFLLGVEDDWGHLMRARTSPQFPKSFVAYEIKKTFCFRTVNYITSKTVVDEAEVSFDYAHADIVKPRDALDDQYRWVKARILGNKGSLEADEADLNITALTEHRVSSLDGYPELKDSEGRPVYTGGARLSFTLSHNRHGSHSVLVHGLVPHIHSHRTDCPYQYCVNGDLIVGAGTTQPHVFRLILEGCEVKASAWILKSGVVETNRSNLFQYPGSELITLKNDTDDVAQIQGTVIPITPGLYEISFQFLYSIGGKDRSKTSDKIYIYKASAVN